MKTLYFSGPLFRRLGKKGVTISAEEQRLWNLVPLTSYVIQVPLVNSLCLIFLMGKMGVVIVPGLL